MSSSRIIKSERAADSPVAGFRFQPIGHASEARDAGSFQPMGLFDGSELAGQKKGYAEQETSLPPSVTISEEELDLQLKEAFSSGLQEGKNLAERGLANVFRSLRAAAEAIHALRDKVLRESEDEVIKLVILVARKVIMREITQNRSILADVVRSAVSGLSEREEITIRLHPDDLALITSGHEEMLRRELHNERMHLKPDPGVPAGNCLIDTEMGTIDARVEAQLDEIYRRLLEEKNQPPAGGLQG